MKNCLVVLLLLTLVHCLYASPETENWRADLRYLADQLPAKHANAFHQVSREEFEAAVRELNDRIPDLSREEIIVGMMRIVSLIGDGHTTMSPFHNPNLGLHYLPIQLYVYKDGLFVQSAAPEHKELPGARLISIGQLTAEEALKRVAAVVPHDNEMGIRSLGPSFLVMPEVLKGLGIIQDLNNTKCVFESEGKRFEKTLHPAGLVNSFEDPPLKTAGWIDARTAKSPPLYLRDPWNTYWYQYLPESKTVYLQFNQVAEKHDEPITPFFQKVFQFVNEHEVEKFVLDLRFNLGGNGYYNKPALLGLIQTHRIYPRGKLFVIIGRNTFSAAQNLVNEIEKYTNAIFVGEPTASNVNSYGDHEPILLPNSKITVMVSTLWWQMDPKDHRQSTRPQVPVELTSLDYRNGIDPVLEAILKCRYEPVSGALEKGLQANDWSEIQKSFLDFRNDPSHECINVEQEMNSVGYDLLRKNEMEKAIEILRINAESFPHSANVYDSLGEAYLKAGRKELAIANYRKALELNPHNGRAKQLLDELMAH